LLECIRPALKTIDPKLPTAKRIADAVESNVRWSLAQLASVPRHKKTLDEGRTFLVGAVYALNSG
jgi:carbonic anhydrase